GVSLQEEKRSYIARFSGKSSKLKLSYRRSISVLTSVVQIQNWHRFKGKFVLWCGDFWVN
ncbi:hypothetical protein P3607_25730, partial [Vibrio parahaemolyticus]|uniref:hypothetical protein n=1 Tax=Vibrio parahaemolyticus TaxID=670 RepID=UPI001D16A7D6